LTKVRINPLRESHRKALFSSVCAGFAGIFIYFAGNKLCCLRASQEFEAMLKIERILCSTDLSSESDEALRYATALAGAYEAKLLLLYCRQPGSVVEWATSSQAARLFEQALFRYIDANELRALDWEAVLTEGDDKGLAIAAEAAKRNADLIVMRSRRRPHAAVLLGSTAETVCRTAPCPVLVTHPSEREWVGLTTCEIDLHRVLVAYDSSGDADLALKYGTLRAQQYQTEVHLLHVISDEAPDEPQLAWSDARREGSYEIAARRLQQAVPKETCLWCNIVTAVRCGHPANEILAYAKEHEIDLICMGASGKGFRLDKLFGSTVDRVLRHAPCPVLISRPVKRAAESVKAA
jgi:nucleotide-binding universal stress UspA family protein